jgi:membrane-associated phospholipid phosphatase
MIHHGGKGRSASGPGLRLALRALLGALAATLTLGTLAWALGEPLVRLDERILHALAAHGLGSWERAALQATALGNATTLAVLVFWVSAFLWLAGRRFAVLCLVVAAVGGRLLNEGLKAMFDRARPEVLEWGAPVTSASFPSAHAMTGAIVYGALAYLVAEAPDAAPGAGRRAMAWAVAGLIVLAIATSRVVLGVHYPSDVAGGVLAGAVWTIFVMSALTSRAGVG